MTRTKEEGITLAICCFLLVATLATIGKAPIPSGVIIIMEQHEGTRELIHDSTDEPLNVHTVTLHHYTVADRDIENL